MADNVWDRPRIPTGESVAAALRLAKKLKPDACVLCDGDDGATELIVRQGGKVVRHVLYASGATERVEVHEPLPRYRRHRHLLDLRGIVFEHNVAAWSGGAVWTARVAALAWVIPLFALLYFHRWLYFLVGVGVCCLIGAVASRFKPRTPRSLAGERRFTVQMEAPSD